MQMAHFAGGDPVEEWLESFERSRHDTNRPIVDMKQFHQVKRHIQNTNWEAYLAHRDRLARQPVAYRPLSLAPYAGLQQPQRVQYRQPQQYAGLQQPQQVQYRPRAQQYDGRIWTVPLEQGGGQIIHRVLA